MKALKIIMLFLVIMVLFLPSYPEKRAPRKTMKELTDPNSPSYVPYPYPKTREEIIADIKYYYDDASDSTKYSFVGDVPIDHIICMSLCKSDSNYKFGKIVKVKNRQARLPDNYTWLVYVMDSEGDAVMRIYLRASGLVMGGGAIDKNEFYKYPEKTKKMQQRLLKVLKEKEVKTFFSQSLGFVVDETKIKKLERIGLYSPISRYHVPLWEITMKDKTVYYYSEAEDMVYKIREKIPWKKDKNGLRPDKRAMVPLNTRYLPDTLNDELVVLEPVSGKTE